jgi:hypothetical protein
MTMNDLLSLFDDLIAYLDRFSDAEIGPDGRVIGNEALKLMMGVEEAYEAIEKHGLKNEP